MERTVEVWGKPQTVGVYQLSKSVWIASGEYLGEPHMAQDRSANAAVLRWSEWARSKGSRASVAQDGQAYAQSAP